jgi:hypothetical protein
LIYSGLTSVIPKGYADNKNITKITKNKTLDKRNPPPLTVSCAPSGDKGSTFTFKQKKKNKNSLFHVKIKIPVGCEIFRRIRRIEKHIPIGVVERMSQRKPDRL